MGKQEYKTSQDSLVSVFGLCGNLKEKKHKLGKCHNSSAIISICFFFFTFCFSLTLHFQSLDSELYSSTKVSASCVLRSTWDKTWRTHDRQIHVHYIDCQFRSVFLVGILGLQTFVGGFTKPTLSANSITLQLPHSTIQLCLVGSFFSFFFEGKKIKNERKTRRWKRVQSLWPTQVVAIHERVSIRLCGSWLLYYYFSGKVEHIQKKNHQNAAHRRPWSLRFYFFSPTTCYRLCAEQGLPFFLHSRWSSPSPPSLFFLFLWRVDRCKLDHLDPFSSSFDRWQIKLQLGTAAVLP